MINTEKLKKILVAYKSDFDNRWNHECYKWEAIQHFQKNWNINAPNFGEMFNKATEKTGNLLKSVNYLPKGMICDFADADDDAVRKMFQNLYDESVDLLTRVKDFILESRRIKNMYNPGSWKHTFQNTNAISTYLWLKYPDKYYIYKYEVYCDVARELNSDYYPKKSGDGSIESIIGGFQMYDEICKEVSEDTEILELLQSHTSENCYPDSKLKTTTFDLGFYISKEYQKSYSSHESEEMITMDEDGIHRLPIMEISSENPSIWKISEGTEDTGISTINKEIFLNRNVVVVDRYTNPKANSNVSQGESFISDIKKGDYFYLCFGNSIQLLGQFINDTCVQNPELKNNWYEREYQIIADSEDKSAYSGIKKWWTPNENSTCIKIKDDDYSLFEELILQPYFNMKINDLLNEGKDKKNYWWLNVIPKIWSFSDINIGDEESCTLYNENNHKRRIFQNFLDAKVGDAIIGYEVTPIKKIVAIGEITQASDGEKITFTKTEMLSSPIGYDEFKDNPELQEMEFLKNNKGTLFKLSKNEYDIIMDIIRDANPSNTSVSKPEIYTKEMFLGSVFMDEEKYNKLNSLLRFKKNIILQGAPGVGKTFTAKKLAYVMMGEEDESRIKIVQFHQNYSYEDFIMGYRPVDDGFKLIEGVFYDFCILASNHPDKDYFFIIDEINRGNLSKIFGELMMLIEKDYRGTKITLAYNGKSFSVPDNLFIIGMMNTADRSLAIIDYALRRRFSFFEMEPGFTTGGFKKYKNGLKNDIFNALIDKVIELNVDIENDSSLGKGYRIGHSYFCGSNKENCTKEWMQSVVEFEIIPLIEEYWFDNESKLKTWKEKLLGVFKE